MIETLGLAVAAEIPMVLMDIMRAGPSTGIASKTEQSDVNLAIYGAHGDAPRVVLAPVSVADCINTAEYAVYIAESLQIPVIVLSDQALGQATTVIDPSAERPKPLKRVTDGAAASKPFKRYAIGPDPVTAMPLPGTAGREWVAEGLTHNEAGLPASGAGVHSPRSTSAPRKCSASTPANIGARVGARARSRCWLSARPSARCARRRGGSPYPDIRFASSLCACCRRCRWTRSRACSTACAASS